MVQGGHASGQDYVSRKWDQSLEKNLYIAYVSSALRLMYSKTAKAARHEIPWNAKPLHTIPQRVIQSRRFDVAQPVAHVLPESQPVCPSRSLNLVEPGWGENRFRALVLLFSGVPPTQAPPGAAALHCNVRVRTPLAARVCIDRGRRRGGDCVRRVRDRKAPHDGGRS